MKTTGELFEYLFDKYELSITKEMKNNRIWSLVILICIILICLLYTWVLSFSLGPNLRTEVLESRGMLKLIPKEILGNNKRIRDILLQGREDFDEKRRKRLQKHRYNHY